MKVLITGGNGFLGAWIVRRLLARGMEVAIFDVVENRRLVAAIAGPGAARVGWSVEDVVDAGDVATAAAGCDAIVNLAGILTPACKAAAHVPRRGDRGHHRLPSRRGNAGVSRIGRPERSGASSHPSLRRKSS